MATLTVCCGDRTLHLPVSAPTPMYQLLADLPESPGRPCGGGGRCGGCAVYASGSLTPPADDQGQALSCQTLVTGDAQVWLPSRQVMTQIETQVPPLPTALHPVEGQYGAAVDIGTTTLVLQLVCLRTGETLATVACENPQRTIAADVIGRIETALAGGLPMLTSMIHQAVDTLEQEALRQAGLSVRQCDCRVIAGNTTMLYLYAGHNPEALSHAPFEADHLFGLRIGRNLLPRCAGAFVGADITCSLLSSGMCDRDETALLMDIGTNGEIALWHQGQLTCCATAAGPAFEGGGICCGTGSVPGAIDRVWVEQGQLAFDTIQHAPACGLCGSGLIDLAAALLDLSLLDDTGAMDEEEIHLTDQVLLSQHDVRQLQLAKGALAAGAATLLDQAGLAPEQVSRFYLAGGFGSHLNLRSAVRIGLLPECFLDRTVILGNASLGGALELLRNQGSWDKTDRLARSARCVNLAAMPAFSSAFMSCLLFGDE